VNYGFVIDTRSCIGCHACTTACKSENQVPLGVNRTWVRYTESGQFVDFTDGSIFRDTFPASGVATGPTVLGGIRVPMGGSSLGFEARWQDAKGNLPANGGFAGDKIDLGGMNYLATFRVTF